MTAAKITPASLREMKQRGEKIAALTAYDCPMTRVLDEAGIPFILVGDSLAMVVLGFPDTTHVRMVDMAQHPFIPTESAVTRPHATPSIRAVRLLLRASSSEDAILSSDDAIMADCVRGGGIPWSSDR